MKNPIMKNQEQNHEIIDPVRPMINLLHSTVDNFNNNPKSKMFFKSPQIGANYKKELGIENYTSDSLPPDWCTTFNLSDEIKGMIISSVATSLNNDLINIEKMSSNLWDVLSRHNLFDFRDLASQLSNASKNENIMSLANLYSSQIMASIYELVLLYIRYERLKENEFYSLNESIIKELSDIYVGTFGIIYTFLSNIK